MGRRLLVPDQDMLHLVLRVQGIIDVQHRTARIAEQVFDPFVLQCAHKYFSASQFHRESPGKSARLARRKKTPVKRAI